MHHGSNVVADKADKDVAKLDRETLVNENAPFTPRT